MYGYSKSEDEYNGRKFKFKWDSRIYVKQGYVLITLAVIKRSATLRIG